MNRNRFLDPPGYDRKAERYLLIPMLCIAVGVTVWIMFGLGVGNNHLRSLIERGAFDPSVHLPSAVTVYGPVLLAWGVIIPVTLYLIRRRTEYYRTAARTDLLMRRLPDRQAYQRTRLFRPLRTLLIVVVFAVYALLIVRALYLAQIDLIDRLPQPGTPN